jgi:hypothetical protein
MGCKVKCSVFRRLSVKIIIFLLKLGFIRGSSCSVLIAFFQSYIKHDLRKNKIVVSFFCQQINFYELIFRF